MVKRTVSIIMLLAALMLLAACGSGEKPRAAYSEPVEFEGEAHEVSVMFVNVGKADCAIVDIDGHFWLIDTGTEESFPNVFAALEEMGADSVDGIVLTHEHGDHIGGLHAISRRYSVGTVVWPALLLEPEKLTSAVYSNGLTGRSVTAGERLEITDGVYFDVLAPTEPDQNDDNDNSLVLMLGVNGRRFLFTGDMQFSEDGRLTASGADIKCDVLKVPNHGNPDATSGEFAKAASPLIAVVSTDTAVDTDSANRSVLAKLTGAEKFLTQDYPLGVLVSVADNGAISVSFPEKRAPQAEGLAFAEVSKEKQSFTLTNTGESAIDLSGFAVYSTRGGEVFVFPEGTVLAPNGSVTVAAKNGADGAELIWDEKKIWADKKDDFAVLIDRFGNELAREQSR